MSSLLTKTTTTQQPSSHHHPAPASRASTSTSTSSLAPPALLPHPSTVGNSFVKQYYHLLAQSPETLHRFYKDDSKFTHGVGSHDEHSISGQKHINDKIMRLGFEGAHVDLESGSVDCQSSLDGGVLVMVAGIITLKGSTPRAFVQTFFLAVQPNGYFVLNDAFRYLETLESTMIVHKTLVKTTRATSMTSPPLPPSPHPTTRLPPTEPSPDDEVVASSAPPAGQTTTSSSPMMTSSSSPPAGRTTTSTSSASPVVQTEWSDIPASPVAKASSSPKEAAAAGTTSKPSSSTEEVKSTKASSAPKSWASHLFMGAKPETAQTTGKKQPSPKASKKISKSSTGWGDVVPETSTTSSPATAAPQSDVDQLPNTATSKASPPPHAPVLYIRDLPSHAKESDVLDLFSPFGTITGTTVAATKGYAFVDYESFSSVEAALKCCPFMLLDTPIHVEVRPPDRRDGNRYYRDSRSSRGRGGKYNNGRGNNSSTSNGRSSFSKNPTANNSNNMKSARSRTGGGKQSA